MKRRDFAAGIVGAAVAGIIAGAGNRAKAAGPIAFGQEGEKAKHACHGMNECKGQGGCKTAANECAGKNECKGKGGCATVAHHDCAGKNDCKGQGGCKTAKNECAGKNECKGHGGCSVPVKKHDTP